MTPLTVSDLTQATLTGTGTLDVLMRTMKAHLDEEFGKGRIKGPEYSTVYLGSIEAAMQTALGFLLNKDKAYNEAELIAAQVLLADAQRRKVEEEILLVKQQTANAVIEATVLTAQKCKLDAEFDVLQAQKLKVTSETGLMNQKINTEKAQTVALGVDEDSVIGRQKQLYLAQRDGFTRDAEQKAAKVMVETWNTRRMTDEGTVADATNLLNDVSVGRAVAKLLSGVGA